MALIVDTQAGTEAIQVTEVMEVTRSRHLVKFATSVTLPGK